MNAFRKVMIILGNTIINNTNKWHLQCAMHYSKFFINVESFNPYNSMKAGIITIKSSILRCNFFFYILTSLKLRRLLANNGIF